MSKFWKSSSSSSSSEISSASSTTSLDDEQNTNGEDDNLKDDFKHTLDELCLKKTEKDYTEDELSQNPNIAWESIKSKQIFADVPRVTAREQPYDPSLYTRIVCISDTHGNHRKVILPETYDVLIHAGDFTNLGEPNQVADVSDYFANELRGRPSYSSEKKEGSDKDSQQMEGSRQQKRQERIIICIAGNHEVTFQPPDRIDQLSKRFQPRALASRQIARRSLSNCHYLEDSGTSFNESYFYGSPWQPWFWDWAFNLPRGKDCRTVWERIPNDADVLITHGPPLGRGDVCPSGHVGCFDLLREVQNRVMPRLHVFGHVHEGYGVTFDGRTMFVNASSVTRFLLPRNPCVVIDLPHDKSLPPVVVEPYSDLSGNELIRWIKSQWGWHECYDILVSRLEQSETSIDGKFLLRNTLDCICECLLISGDAKLRNLLGDVVAQLRAQSFR